MFLKNLVGAILLAVCFTTSVNAQLFFNRRAYQQPQYAPMQVQPQQQSQCYQQQLLRQQQMARLQQQLYQSQLEAQQFDLARRKSTLNPASPANQATRGQQTTQTNRVQYVPKQYVFVDRRTGRRVYRTVLVPTAVSANSTDSQPQAIAQSAAPKAPVALPPTQQKDVARASWEYNETIAPAETSPEGSLQIQLNEPMVGSQPVQQATQLAEPVIEAPGSVQPASAVEPVVGPAPTPAIDSDEPRSILESVIEEKDPGALSGLDLSGN